MTRHGSYQFLACWEEHPSLEVQPPSDIEECFDGRSLIAQVWNPYRELCVSRKTGNRMFVIHDADGNASASQAPHDSQPLIVAANYNGARNITLVRSLVF
jgi:hypothetical protein